MARENMTLSFGVSSAPQLTIEYDENGEAHYTKGILYVDAPRRTYADSELMIKGKARWDKLCIYSRNEAIIRDQMKGVEEGDVVLVFGTLSTQNVPKKFICPRCKTVNELQGTICYIDPLKVLRVWSGLDEETAYKVVFDAQEIGNRAKFMATVCREPEFYSDGKFSSCTFQVATNRIRRIAEDGPDVTADYPWVRTFRDIAKESKEALHVGSEIYINGSIQVREVERMIECESCSHHFNAADKGTEVIPYNIEYISDCILPETNESDEESYMESNEDSEESEE